MDTFDDTYKSRSQKKRESTALQQLGEELTSLSPANLSALCLPHSLREAIDTFQTLKGHEAKRRQLQYIGRVMREVENTETLTHELQNIKAHGVRDTKFHHQLETIREQLLNADEALSLQATQALLQNSPHIQAKELQRLVANARDTDEQKKKKHAKELFRFLKKELGQ